MKKFLAIYLGSQASPAFAQWNAMPEAERKERQRSGTEAWMRWGKEHAKSIVDTGTPLGKTKRVDRSGVSDARNMMTGYALIEAQSHEAAARQFANHPHFSIFPGESVEIMECLPLPKMPADEKSASQAASGTSQGDRVADELPSTESAIRRLIEGWAAAVRAKDIDGVLAHHTDDVLMFDVPPPAAVRGIAAYRATWPPFFEALSQGHAAFDIVELNVTAGDTVAFATALLRCGSVDEQAKDGTPRLRLTLGLRKVDGVWRIAHEHHSFPAS
jgi:uncharacterized protein (TIGR02246 family)